MKHAAYGLFETPLGWCGITWSDGPNPAAPWTVTCFRLPEATVELTECRIAHHSGVVNLCLELTTGSWE